jgi:hypothetical protein
MRKIINLNLTRMKFSTDTIIGKGQIDFLIKECESLMKSRQEMSDLQEKRLSAYSVILAFSIAFIGQILGNMSNEDGFPIMRPIFLCFVGLTIILTGLITFSRIVYRHKQMEMYKIKLDEVKNHLIEALDFTIETTQILNYNIFEVNAIKKWRLSVSLIVTLLNSLQITLYICLFFRFTYLKDIDSRYSLIPISILVYSMSFLGHYSLKMMIEKQFCSK